MTTGAGGPIPPAGELADAGRTEELLRGAATGEDVEGCPDADEAEVPGLGLVEVAGNLPHNGRDSAR